jgi:hypothetical protein
MKTNLTSERLAWVLCGALAIFSILMSLPAGQLGANTGDRSSEFSMVTVPINGPEPGGIAATDGVFILDLRTGMLKGGVLSRNTGRFESLYVRDVRADLTAPGDDPPRFCMVSGSAQLPKNNDGRVNATGVIYIGELSSGKVMAYSIIKDHGLPLAVKLIPVATFDWRDPGT